LICPRCRHPLARAADAHTCSGCGGIYRDTDGIAVLLAADQSRVTRLEREYWDQRFAQEADLAPLRRLYESPAFFDDDWGLHRYHRRILRTVGRGASVLEIGAGLGSHAIALALHHAFTAVVTDVAVAGLARNRQAVEAIGRPAAIEYYAAEADHLPFEDGGFDVVLLHAALHHLAAPESAVREMVRCLRPGGLLVLGYEPNRTVFKPLRRLADRLRITERYSQRFVADRYSVADDETPGFSARQLRAWAAENGLGIEWLEPVWFVSAVLYHLPVLADLALHRTLSIPQRVRRLGRRLDDAVFARTPGVRNLCLAWSLGARKPAAPEGA
jgi:SAM-dependent methyltransferase